MGDRPAYVDEGAGATVVKIFVQPRAAKDELVGVHGDALKIKVRAVPEAGKANEAALRVLAGMLGVAPSRLQLVSGASSRHKKIAVRDADPAAIAARVEPLLALRGGR